MLRPINADHADTTVRTLFGSALCLRKSAASAVAIQSCDAASPGRVPAPHSTPCSDPASKGERAKNIWTFENPASRKTASSSSGARTGTLGADKLAVWLAPAFPYTRGLINGTSIVSKALTLRVTTLIPKTRIVAEMRAS